MTKPTKSVGHVLGWNLLPIVVVYVAAYVINGLFLHWGDFSQQFVDVGLFSFSTQLLAAFAMLMIMPMQIARDVKHRHYLVIAFLAIAAIACFFFKIMILIWAFFLLAFALSLNQKAWEA